MITIIGAGVIGLAIAAQVAGKGHEVYMLEKNETFGKETSSRNSETIHAGIYYPEESLKAKTCVRGNALIYELCRQYGIPCRKTGKLLVATVNEEVEQLELLVEQRKKSGVDDLSILAGNEIEELEPNIKAVAAVLSPSSGVIDAHALMRFFLSRAREKGAEIVHKSEVVGIERLSDAYEVTVEDESRGFTFKTEIVINCASMQSCNIARLAGIDVDEAGYRLHYCKGEYFSVAGGKGKLV
ncbi:MAG: FAD-dependent oxidoreductase, partial [Dehalococcoidia bacterium]